MHVQEKLYEIMKGEYWRTTDTRIKSYKTEKTVVCLYDYVGEYHLDNICADIDGAKIEITILYPTCLDDWFIGILIMLKRKKQRKFIKAVSLPRLLLFLYCLFL